MYDSVYPTRTARFGVALVPSGVLKLKNAEFSEDFRRTFDGTFGGGRHSEANGAATRGGGFGRIGSGRAWIRERKERGLRRAGRRWRQGRGRWTSAAERSGVGGRRNMEGGHGTCRLAAEWPPSPDAPRNPAPI
eukprot:366275-Chlamydomonas_euryale.AAC.10